MCHQHHQWNELVCLKQNQVCIHCPSFLDEHFSSTKRGRKRKGRRRRVCGCVCVWKIGQKRAGTAVKEETQGKRRLAEQESPPSLGYDWFFPCARTTKTKSKKKDLQNGALKNKDDRGKGELLAGMWCWLLMCCWYFFFFFFLFHKATLGFDAVVVIRGLAAATGFGLGALLDVCLRHTPPGGEVEGHTPCPRENPIPLNAIPLQLVKTQSRRLMCETDWVELDVSRVSVSSESSPVQF